MWLITEEIIQKLCCFFIFQDTHFDVQGLYENSVYNFRVSAVNDYGSGDFITTASPIVAKMPFGM